ncbi:hypothetical protein PG996_002782 [Apiospora saccharicola]|uniref:DUF2530 domain-containing protein n=1 Tax=Apiospora saccharicola TaxID=335842 RepID=A0ABR1WKI2_9PEZI
MPTVPSTRAGKDAATARCLLIWVWAILAWVDFAFALVFLLNIDKITASTLQWLPYVLVGTSGFLIGAFVNWGLESWIRSREARMADVEESPVEENRPRPQ